MSDETDTTSEVARVLREHFDPTGTERHDPYAAAVYEEAAEALAEAGLLREEAPADLAFVARNIVSQLGDLYADFLSPLTKDRAEFVKYRQATNDHADRFVLRLLRTVQTEQAQIAAQEPAGATQGGSGDAGTSGGSCARCGAGITVPADDPENYEMAVCAPCEITVLKEGYMAARAQVERVRAQLARMTKSSDGKTQRHGTALLHILDGTVAP